MGEYPPDEIDKTRARDIVEEKEDQRLVECDFLKVRSKLVHFKINVDPHSGNIPSFCD
jgi:hypothetical protein